MRVFYIFKINKEFKILTKNNSLNLYKSIEDIYHLNVTDYELGITLFETLTEKINKKEINVNLFLANKVNENYTKYQNVHMINDYFSNELTKLEVKNSHLLLKSTKQIPSFLKELNYEKNLFVCDFYNKDYFWIDELNLVK